MPVFPNIPEGFETKMKAIEMAIGSGEGGVEAYLADAGCPYSEVVRGYIRKLFSVGVGVVERGDVRNEFEGLGSVDRFDKMLEELELTISELKNLQSVLSVGDSADDTTARLQVLKSKTTLIEKWTSIKGDLYNLRELSQFQGIVLNAMDEVLDKDQRALMVERLKGLRTIDFN